MELQPIDNTCHPDNPNHIRPKHLGLVGVSVTVSEPTPREAYLGELFLEPLRRRLGMEPRTIVTPAELKPNIIHRILSKIPNSF